MNQTQLGKLLLKVWLIVSSRFYRIFKNPAKLEKLVSSYLLEFLRDNQKSDWLLSLKKMGIFS